jgi:phage-related protein
LDGDRIDRQLVLVVVIAIDEAVHSLVCVEIVSSTPTTTPTTTTTASIYGRNGSSIRLDNQYDQKISSTPP